MKEERKNPETRRRSRGRDVLHIASLAFTERGRALARRTEEACRRVPGREIIWKNIEEIDGETFRISDVVFFFCAAGIAVRKIAPFLQDKTSDPAVLVIGSEGFGIREKTAENCDQIISIPQRGGVESLNASAAASIIMYDMMAKVQLKK